jgi:hypothetical protein
MQVTLFRTLRVYDSCSPPYPPSLSPLLSLRAFCLPCFVHILVAPARDFGGYPGKTWSLSCKVGELDRGGFRERLLREVCAGSNRTVLAAGSRQSGGGIVVCLMVG